MDVLHAGIGYSLVRIDEELTGTIATIVNKDAIALAAFVEVIAAAPRVFIFGAGRSGLALQMTAMRLMHLGLEVHVVGEVTTPSIASGDVLLTASGSGTTPSVLRSAQLAASVGASVAVITTASGSPLAALASASVIVPAADKLDRSGAASVQYAGSLFEQTVVLIGDALFHALWIRSGLTADEIWPRHANLE